jgi:hypothetical protein
MFNKDINYFQEKFFTTTIIIVNILVLLTVLGISKTAPKYLDTIEFYVKIYVCLFLIWRFNPFRQVKKFTNLDKKIAFSSGMIILTTSFLTNILEYKNNYIM